MRRLITSLVVMCLLVAQSAPLVSAIDITPNDCASVNKDDCKLINENKLDSSNGRPSALKNALNTAFVVLGMIAVLMIVIGGFKYTASNGDPSLVSSAKNTILYAIVGLIVAALSFAAVNTVIDFL